MESRSAPNSFWCPPSSRSARARSSASRHGSHRRRRVLVLRKPRRQRRPEALRAPPLRPSRGHALRLQSHSPPGSWSSRPASRSARRARTTRRSCFPSVTRPPLASRRSGRARQAAGPWWARRRPRRPALAHAGPHGRDRLPRLGLAREIEAEAALLCRSDRSPGATCGREGASWRQAQ
jgi:hypothetical protein